MKMNEKVVKISDTNQYSKFDSVKFMSCHRALDSTFLNQGEMVPRKSDVIRDT